MIHEKINQLVKAELLSEYTDNAIRFLAARSAAIASLKIHCGLDTEDAEKLVEEIDSRTGEIARRSFKELETVLSENEGIGLKEAVMLARKRVADV